MQLLINGQKAVLRQGLSFTFVSENRLFSDADAYTLSLSLPLKDCPQNQKIFGYINRKDLTDHNLIYDAELRDLNFAKTGCVVITEITHTDVEVQFLEGRSMQNFYRSFKELYIDELTLGNFPALTTADVEPWEVWDPNLATSQGRYVALPWWNDRNDTSEEAYDGNWNNRVKQNTLNGGTWIWDYEDGKKRQLSWQPYLLYVTQQICKAVGYTADLSEWEQHEELKYLLICNTLPGSWEEYSIAKAMPHWTVEEYFNRLELFIGSEFDIDHRAKSITFRTTKTLLDSISDVQINKVIDEYKTAVDSEENPQSKYRGAKNIQYKECSHSMWKFYSCDWIMKPERVVKVNTLQALIESLKQYRNADQAHRDSGMEKIYYAADVDTHFLVRAFSRVETGKTNFGARVFSYNRILQPLNDFGARIIDPSEDAQTVNIEFVPVCIDCTTEEGRSAMFLSPGDTSGQSDTYSTPMADGRSIQERMIEIAESWQYSELEKRLQDGEKSKSNAYYDRIFVGWWDGAMDSQMDYPHPHVHSVVINPDWSGYYFPHMSMRINKKGSVFSQSLKSIDARHYTTFKFLAHRIPNVRATFYIRGKKYLCEKITATFTENGMSQLMEGVFWEIKS